MQLSDVKGIGKALLAKLAKAGINSVAELVETLPASYQEKRISPFSAAAIGREITLKGTLKADATVFFIRRQLTKLTFYLLVDKVVFSVVIFNREYLRNSLVKDQEVVVTGKFTANLSTFTASEITLAKNFQEGILPVYPVDFLSSRQFHKLVLAALPGYLTTVAEDLPEAIIARNGLLTKQRLMQIAHRPRHQEDIDQAARSIKYREFIEFALKVEGYRKLNQRVVKEPLHYDIDLVRRFIATLPFALTEDQKQAANAIFRDLKAARPMNRLLQGEVGSGKTIVAILAMLATVSGSHQVAVMAPTEILAYQNHQVISDHLERYGIRCSLLTGSTPAAAREMLLQALAKGKIDIIVGTHALIEEKLDICKLGLVVIDEQHRFGVRQRQILRQKGQTPDVLLLSATPIPRTLALTLFRDLDVSTVRILPANRQPIITEVVDFTELPRIYEATLTELEQGRQAYFIVPLIAETTASSLMSIAEFSREIGASALAEYPIGYLHGKLKAQEKQAVLQSFYDNQTKILVATTVVEVGVNVPNATMMVVLSANRFGLSQLHQLRGRVGRGAAQAKCFFVAEPELEAKERLAILATTNDGFAISLEDLRQRGPGALFGEEQAGIMRFGMANLITDAELLECALKDAAGLLASDDPLAVRLVRRCFRSLDAYILD